MTWNTLFFTIFAVIYIIVQVDAQYGGIGSFPVVFNLATRAEITANGTCGQSGPEQYCKLVEHVKRNRRNESQCGICDENSVFWNQHHPAQYAIDGSQSWWQSSSIAQGGNFHYVTITLDLKQVFHVAYVIVKSANSPRPGNWILERSLDGSNFTAWQYFALSDSECWNAYGMKPTVGIARFTSDAETICTSRFSRLDPLENGEIHVSLVNGRPGVDGPSQELMDFTAARYIRLRFEKIKTLNADLMTFITNRPEDIHQSVTNRYFYSVKDISVGGQCICNGHASYCPYNEDTGKLQCDCEGNTCGDSCEICCPFFNQKPWQPGTYYQAAQCEECNCNNHADSCYYNQTVTDLGLSMNIYGVYEGGGVCQACRDNTRGINCDTCIEDYYRPHGIPLTHPQACQPCRCDQIGSTGDCVKDESMIHMGIMPGDCICKEGYCGEGCSECADGYTGYPDCVPCPCSKAGSLNVDTCEVDCICKTYVCGDFCDECLPGFFNLQDSNPDGCDPCFCFGITDKCSSSDWKREHVTDLNGWEVTDLVGTTTLTPTGGDEDGFLYIQLKDLQELNYAIYWQAPQSFMRNKVLSYGGQLEYLFVYTTNLTERDPDAYLGNWDVILEGGGMRLGHSGLYYKEDTENTMIINMTETDWRHLANSSMDYDTPVPREEFLILLADIDRFLIRAGYHMYQKDTKLVRVGLDVASETGYGPQMPAMEICECPEGYAGTSCELCAPGFRRVGNILFGGSCEPCLCNGHSDHCDGITGECFDCQHNTQGAFCELCLPNFRGNATQGTPDGCKPCGCPLEEDSNSFAAGCVDTPGEENEYMCIDCSEGYEGMFCEMCSNGYYGNPLELGSRCQSCECNGNVDDTVKPYCDPFSGRCLFCEGHTMGDHCEHCEPGYYGTAIDGDCQVCECDAFGSLSTICDPVTGQCSCKDLYHGRRCEECQEGFGNTLAGCPSCNCTDVAADTPVCDSVTGGCHCQPGAGGMYCDTCQPGFYGYSMAGCKECNCASNGSISDSCDMATGDCLCKPNVIGKHCEECMPDYWGIDSGQGCTSCDCDPIGAKLSQCDLKTGQCVCKPGIGGEHCDQCEFGHYGFSEDGCKPCQECEAEGMVCDPKYGNCVCPPNTEGDMCEKCAPDTWGHDPKTGCRPCECDPNGSNTTSCDVNSGQCQCKEGIMGIQCHQCEFGHYGFPDCAPCHCNAQGTIETKCNEEGICQCEPDGQCPCKEHVIGRKCVACTAGTFSLQEGLSKGCTTCYCFGRSDRCAQASYMWLQLSVDSRTIQINEGEFNSIEPNSKGYLVIPFIPQKESTLNVYTKYMDRPMYWSLPPVFHGDKTLSYNGKLMITITRKGGDDDLATTAPEYKIPIVQLTGNSVVKLNYLGPSGGENGDINVTFREEYWIDGTGRQATREELMMALQNVQEILVYLGTPGEYETITIEKTTLEYAAPKNDSEPTHLSLGVERCDCPPEYSGLSCQNPAEGYFRDKRPENSSHVINPENIIGISIPCNCNGHSYDCDQETGLCRNCQHLTEGDHCQRCKPGYFGNATGGTPYDCQLCACPLIDNSFADTCDLINGEVVCNNCAPGYVGNRCEICAPGYYGDPKTPGGRCKPCQCDPLGAVSEVCDVATGNCFCQPGIQGKHCDECAPRYALDRNRCISCDEGCPGIIMTDLDDMAKQVASFNSSAAALLPWATVSRIQNTAKGFNTYLETFDFDRFSEVKEELQSVKKLSRDVAEQIPASPDELSSMEKQSISLKEEAMEMEKGIEEGQKSLERFIEKFVREIKDRFAGGASELEAMVNNTEDMLSEVKERSFMQELTETRMQFGESEDMLYWSRDVMEQADKFNFTSVVERLATVKAKLRDLIKIAQNVSRTAGMNMAKNIANNGLIYRIQGTINLIVKNQEKIMNKIEETLAANNKSANQYEQALAAHKDVANASAIVAPKVDEMSAKIDHFTTGINETTPMVSDALAHAQENLDETANTLKSEFADAEIAAEAPVKAANAYQDIKTAIEGAADVVNVTDDTNTQAQDKISTEDHSLVKDVDKAVNKSRELEQKVNDLKSNSSGLSPRLENDKATEAKTLQTNEDIRKILEEVEATMDKLPLMKTNKTANVTSPAAQPKTNNTRIQDIINKTIGDLQPKMDFIMEEPVERNIRRVNRTVDKTNEMIENITSIAETVQKQAMVNEGLMEGIELSLWQLKEKIKQAREQANNLKVSMYNPGDCNRRYQPEVKPSSANTIRLNFKTKRPERGMMLLHLNSKDTNDFMSVHLKGQRVRFTWNTGSDDGSVDHPLVIGAETWYKVEADRLGNVGKLRVGEVADDLPIEEKAATDPANTILNIDNTGSLYLGGAPRDTQIQGIEDVSEFTGCMGSVSIDGNHMGMYNFREMEGDGCDGCDPALVPDSPGTGPGTDPDVVEEFDYHFGGGGYAKVEQGPHDDMRYQVSFKFKGFWNDALLFYTENKKAESYMAVELVNGTIKFSMKTEGNDPITLSSSDTYDSNEWVSVKAARNGPMSRLDINDGEEEIEIYSQENERAPLPLGFQPLYFGGVPATVDVSRYGVTHTRFLGCMKDAEVASNGIQKADLSSNVYIDVAPTCAAEGPRLIGLPGNGFVEIPSEDLETFGDISFTFRTLQEDALLFLARGVQRQNYYSMSLRDGLLNAWFSSLDGSTKIRSKRLLNDGKQHSVMITKSNLQFTMYIDDELSGSIVSGGTYNIDITTANGGGLYVGGVPNNEDFSDSAASVVPLRGCIRDIVINSKLSYMDKPLRFTNADVGRCLSELFNGNTTFPSEITGWRTNSPDDVPDFLVSVSGADSTITTTPAVTTTTIPPTDPTSCARIGRHTQVNGAIAFGDIKFSHAEIEIKRRDVRRDFNISLMFRTFYDKGLIFYISNAVQSEFVAVQVKEGYLVISYDNKGVTKHMSSSSEVDDGLWHMLKIFKDSKTIKLQLDDDAPNINEINRKIDVVAPIYVGGVPQQYKPRANLVSESFKGCLKDFELNGKFEDVANSKYVRGIRRCYKDVEKGAHFDGYGYAVYEEFYQIESTFNVTLDFRTVQRNGVILSISDPSGDPALALQLNDGKMVFKVVNKGREFFAEAGRCPYCLCDNKWHSVRAELVKNVVTLQIDDDRRAVGVSEGYDRFLNTYSELYIGGFPVFAMPQGATETQDSFEGCVRNFYINGTQVDWHSLYELIDVQVSACPISVLDRY